MKMDDAVQVIKPAPDSHYRLVPCQCGSDNVAYVLGADGRWRVQCFDCGHTGAGDLDPTMWLVVKDTPERMELVHRHFDHVTKTIPKGGREAWDM